MEIRIYLKQFHQVILKNVIDSMKQYLKLSMIRCKNSITGDIIATMPADGLAPTGARPLAGMLVASLDVVYIHDKYLKSWQNTWPQIKHNDNRLNTW